MRSPSVAFGPRTTAPSWSWVGEATARQLRRHYRISCFGDFAGVPAADVVVVVKQHPGEEWLCRLKEQGSRLIFLPIDRYLSEDQIGREAALLAACDLVLVHSHELLPRLSPLCRSCLPVEHHARFALPALARYRSEGPLLWVGGCEHVPHVLLWLEHHHPPDEVLLLTNLQDRRARIVAHHKAHQLGLRLHFTEGRLNGHRVMAWSEGLQAQLMATARAAFDVKGHDFGQSTKPPTKGQQFIASGIPFGCPLESPMTRYFHNLGFSVADLRDPLRLFSRDYWQETQRFAPLLRQQLSLEAVAGTYRSAIDGLLSGTTAQVP